MSVSHLPGPPQLLPGRPDAVVDLRSCEGAALVGAEWRWADAAFVPTEFVAVGPDLGPGTDPVTTFDIAPHAEAPEFDDSAWRALAPPELDLRLGSGLVSACWYRTAITVPSRIGDLDVAGSTLVFEIVVDDYAEVWVDGALGKALGDSGSNVASGFNAPNRVVLTADARPGQRFDVAVFGINGPISASPHNYIWVRSASLDVYRPRQARPGRAVSSSIERIDRRIDLVLPQGVAVEMVATGFESTAGPLWLDGALLFSSPAQNTIYRWAPEGRVSVFRVKGGYSGTDIGRYPQPGSAGLALDPEGRLVVCQHGNRQVLRVNPRGDTTVLADSFGGRRLNSPHGVTVGRDGTAWFTDPPAGLPDGDDDPKRELPFSGVFAVAGGADTRLVSDELRAPGAVALSSDERFLFVVAADAAGRRVVRFDTSSTGPPTTVAVIEADAEVIEGGLVLGTSGHLLVGSSSGVWVIDPDGDALGVIRLPKPPSGVTFSDRGDLFITAGSSIYRVASLPALDN